MLSSGKASRGSLATIEFARYSGIRLSGLFAESASQFLCTERLNAVHAGIGLGLNFCGKANGVTLG